jgi:UDP-N-acetylmuramate--alanine ligase
MKIHFVGIGGIGVSALARYYLKNGARVSGSDLVESEITEDLKKLGAKIIINSKVKNQKSKLKKIQNLIKEANLVIYSPAIPKNHPELKLAKKFKIKTLSYPQALGELTKKHFTIAVCGTHGKSTTTALIGLILTKAGFDPTVIVGTKLKEFKNSNCRVGKSKYLVIEADEHFASFLNYWPKIIVLTTLEPDHLDYYKTFKNYLKAFKEFIFHLPKNGILIANEDDKNISKLKTQISNPDFKILTYSLKDSKAKKLRKILKIPGEFNVSNALASLKLAKILKIPEKIALSALSKYRGAWRRFEIKKGKIGNKKFILVHDYAHHPTEIRETLKAAREKFKGKRIFCVFQPHQYQRTFYLFKDFVQIFQNIPIQKLIITDIYEVAGRENKKIKKLVSAEKLVKAVGNPSVIYLKKDKIYQFLKKNLKGKNEVVIFMGAGDIYNLATQFL